MEKNQNVGTKMEKNQNVGTKSAFRVRLDTAENWKLKNIVAK